MCGQPYLKGLHRDGFAVTHGERREGAWRGQTHVLESLQSLRGQREREKGRAVTVKRKNKKKIKDVKRNKWTRIHTERDTNCTIVYSLSVGVNKETVSHFLDVI